MPLGDCYYKNKYICIRYMWNDEYNLFYEDLEYCMHLLPNITLEHINLTSYSKMNVRLAAQVLSSTVSNILSEFAPSYTAGTSKYCEYINNFFDCLNVRVPNAIELIEDGKLVNKKRNPFVKPYKHLNDFRFSWLKNDFLRYLEHWLHSLENRPGTF